MGWRGDRAARTIIIRPRVIRCFNSNTCRAARALLGWSQAQLAFTAKVGLSTVAGYERGQNKTLAPLYVEAMERALCEGGIEFLNHGSPGVRLRPKMRTTKKSLSVLS